MMESQLLPRVSLAPVSRALRFFTAARRARALVRLAPLLPLLGACAASTAPSDETVASTASAIGEEQAGAPMFVLDSGHWSDGGEDGISFESFWVDLSVRNDAYTKDVGVVWSSDGWKTTHTSHAHYKGALAGGRERWGVEEHDFGQQAGWLAPIEVEYAAYATMNGVTSWSPFRDHYVYRPVSPAHPVRLLSSSISLGADGRPVLDGSARALNVAADRHVFVRWSIDQFRTWTDTLATFDGKDFAFHVPLPVIASSTEDVRFAVRLDTEGQQAWDSANGQNYLLQLAPALAGASMANDPGHAADGLWMFHGGVTSALPIDHAWVHVDGGARIALAAMQTGDITPTGFSSNGSFLYPLDSRGLAEGEHTIAIEAAAGPFVRTLAPVRFTVQHGIADLATWTVQPAARPGSGAFWDFARDAQGRVFLSDEDGVRVYASLGASAPTSEFAKSPVSLGVMDIALDDAGRVYGLGGTSLVRWLPSGVIDANFGKGGVLAFSTGTFGAKAICWPADIDVVAGALILVDSCNSRVLRLTLDGGFLDEIDLTSGTAYTNVQKTFRRGDDVWVSRMTMVDGATKYDLVKIAAASGKPLAVSATLPIDASSVDAFAFSGDSLWVADTWGNLLRLDASGHLVATWLGGSGYLPLPGALGIAKHIEPVDGGAVAVLNVAGGTVETFAAR